MLSILAAFLLQPDASARLTQAVDSVVVLRNASRAQVEFESQRRQRLPVDWGSGGRCDVRVGRFCYWYDESLPRGPEEPTTIRPLRDRLIARLAEAAAAIPGDPWIAGQRVRYLVEQGGYGAALAAAEECRAARWWCAALEGFALHAAGDYEAAETAFDRALDSMTSDQRCSWEDPRPLLPAKGQQALDRMSCAERPAWARLRWALADPLWSMPGNDRRTEHFARHVMSEMERVSRSPYHLPWGEDARELTIRYGWPERWSRRPSGGADLGSIHVTGHEPRPAFQFFPNDSALVAPERLADRGWTLHTDLAENRYAPPYAQAAVAVEAQVARFLRGDSVLVLAALETPPDTLLNAAETTWVIAGLDPDGTIHAAPWGARPAPTMLPRSTGWVSLEGRDIAHRTFARYRVALPDTGTMGMVFYRDPRPTDNRLEDVMARMHTSARLRSRERLGLYWEFDGVVAAGDSVVHVISVFPRSASWLTRLARSMRLSEAAAPVHLRLPEPAGSAPSRAIGLDLSGLSPGTYDLHVRTEARGHAVGAAQRTITITR
jgi:tetratricopeptide (TPR) repeat protein